MVLAGSGGIYEFLLIVLVFVLIFNGLKRQKIMNKVALNLNSHSRLTKNKPMVQKKEKVDEVEYIDFEETPE
tara:strand:- start:336 stop:551 length:216 start_codon:yes stop_codon:yes gene_type:complete